MEPLNPQTLQQANHILGEVLSGLPTLAVMWYMLKDLRSIIEVISRKVNDLEIKMAGDDSRVKIGHIDEKLKETKAEAREEIRELQNRILMVENQLPKVWAKIGDRPEDIIKRRERS